MAKTYVALEVKNLASGETVKTIKLEPTHSEQKMERVLLGLLRNLDRERFYVKEIPAEE